MSLASVTKLVMVMVADGIILAQAGEILSRKKKTHAQKLKQS